MNQDQSSSSWMPSLSNRQVILATLAVVAVGAAFWLFYRFRLVVFILFIAIVISTAIRPLVDWLSRRRIPRAAGVVAVFLLILLLLIGFAILVAPIIAEQVTQISGELPEYYGNFRSFIFQSPSRILQRIAIQLPSELDLLAQPEGLPQETEPDPGFPTEPAEPAERLASVAPFLEYSALFFRGLLATLAVFLLAFYWTLEGERLVRSFILPLPLERREQIRDFITASEVKVGGFIRGQAILSFSIGLLALIAYLIIGLPYALILGIIAGIMEAVPVFGPALGAIPAILIALSISPNDAVWVVVATVVIQALENYLLVPRVMNRAVGVNPIVTLLALVALTSLLGLPGALLAIPIAAIIQLLLDRFIFIPHTTEVEKPQGRDYPSLLRYEAQQLAQDVRKQVRSKEKPMDPSADEVEDTIEAIANDLDRVLAQLNQKEVTP